MAKRRSYPRKGKRKPLNWPLILAAAVLVSAFLIVRLSLGSEMFHYLPDLEETRAAFSSLWNLLISPSGQPNKEAVSTGDLTGSTAQVHFIDVGQGDSILIRCDGADILIDAGENNQGETVNAYLDQLGIENLDLVIGTHPHSDHIGGLDLVLSKHPVEQIILPQLPESLIPTTRTFEDLLYAIGQQNLSVTPAVPGNCYEFGEGKLEILGPTGTYEDLNNYSVVCQFTYGEISFLLTGDMEQEAEQDLLDCGADLSADILKLGHHGSSTSTGSAFLKTVSPSACVIEVGEGNSYNHPHAETIQRVEEAGCSIFRTDLDGNILIETDGKNWAVSTEK
ncbi:MAG: ComEC/Rec2 family competence protein [Candidatus Merdivicinus sp.]